MKNREHFQKIGIYVRGGMLASYQGSGIPSTIANIFLKVQESQTGKKLHIGQLDTDTR